MIIKGVNQTLIKAGKLQLSVTLTDNNSEPIVKTINLVFLSKDDFAKLKVKEVSTGSAQEFNWTDTDFRKANKLEFLNGEQAILNYSTNQSATTIFFTDEATP